jgi:hypothetical protein
MLRAERRAFFEQLCRMFFGFPNIEQIVCMFGAFCKISCGACFEDFWSNAFCSHSHIGCAESRSHQSWRVSGNPILARVPTVTQAPSSALSLLCCCADVPWERFWTTFVTNSHSQVFPIRYPTRKKSGHRALQHPGLQVVHPKGENQTNVVESELNVGAHTNSRFQTNRTKAVHSKAKSG